MTWSEMAWQAIDPVFSAITKHPFVAGLIDGSLAKDKFLFYINQDYLYLNDFSRVLAALATTARYHSDTEAFLAFASQAVAVERELHSSFLNQIFPTQSLSPACELYTSYLYKQLNAGSHEIAAAAVLPCFWIYQAVGDFILAQKPSLQNPYRSWIDTYGGEEYAAEVTKAVDIVNRLADETTAAVRKKMTAAFVAASKMEWMFWDSAWRLETWPV
jgi:thiaminase/transcriptional activator TenA